MLSRSHARFSNVNSIPYQWRNGPNTYPFLQITFSSKPATSSYHHFSSLILPPSVTWTSGTSQRYLRYLRFPGRRDLCAGEPRVGRVHRQEAEWAAHGWDAPRQVRSAANRCRMSQPELGKKWVPEMLRVSDVSGWEMIIFHIQVIQVYNSVTSTLVLYNHLTRTGSRNERCGSVSVSKHCFRNCCGLRACWNHNDPGRSTNPIPTILNSPFRFTKESSQKGISLKSNFRKILNWSFVFTQYHNIPSGNLT